MGAKISKPAGVISDDEIRQLVIARLSVLSEDTAMSIGNQGSYTVGELIQHVRAGDKIGETVEKIELEWLRAMKDGIVPDLA